MVADAIRAIGLCHFAGFLDDDAERSGQIVLGYPILGPTSGWRDFALDALVPAIGSNSARRDVILRMRKQGAKLMTVVHPSAVASPSARLGAGVVVLAGAVINADAEIGDNVIINTGAIVEHDSNIGSHSHVAPGCTIAGGVQIGKGVLLGIGSRVLPGLKIGDGSVIGAGAAVVRNVEAHTTVAGVPARRIR